MSDTMGIRDVMQVYFDCMFESSSDKTHQAFHPNAKIAGYNQGDLEEMDVPTFASFVASQRPSAKEKGDEPILEIVSLDIAGDTAIAKVRDIYLGLTFLDTLSFLKVDGQWFICNKLFHVES